MSGAADKGTAPDDDPFTAALRPLVDAVGGEILAPAEAAPGDVMLHWEGHEALAVRLPQLAESLDRILTALERQYGEPLAALDRRTKQEIVRGLEARGAFTVRHGVERAARALGVSRFTVYNYLNRQSAAPESAVPERAAVEDGEV
ncbi:helix-turn-helix domain-containing protein [Streptomyces sp. NA04227]|uniref:helix-turn-helix domain-containing protein n=1 Tax=Streptomyces sp. NA04227 TaxID=2742136 RepID=UPI001590182D|nr:helix-turn-helix domain-containing protein [Streptomyces sp. NA04227]QKW10066.1 helix-turn-helix domain-containing protein [Streptomyces sp. NA04227]